MLTTFIILSLAIAGWTAFTWFHQDERKDDISNILKALRNNLTEMIRNIGKLLLLLFKDAIQSRSNQEIKQAEKSQFSKEKETSLAELDLASTSVLQEQEEKDEALVEFSAEVIELISEEEEKVA